MVSASRLFIPLVSVYVRSRWVYQLWLGALYAADFYLLCSLPLLVAALIVFCFSGTSYYWLLCNILDYLRARIQRTKR